MHRVEERHAVAPQRPEDGCSHPSPNQVNVGDIGMFALQQRIQTAGNIPVIEVIAQSGEDVTSACREIRRLIAGQILLILQTEPDHGMARGFQQPSGVEIDRLGAPFPVVKVIDQQDFH